MGGGGGALAVALASGCVWDPPPHLTPFRFPYRGPGPCAPWMRRGVSV